MFRQGRPLRTDEQVDHITAGVLDRDDAKSDRYGDCATLVNHIRTTLLLFVMYTP